MEQYEGGSGTSDGDAKKDVSGVKCEGNVVSEAGLTLKHKMNRKLIKSFARYLRLLRWTEILKHPKPSTIQMMMVKLMKAMLSRQHLVMEITNSVRVEPVNCKCLGYHWQCC